MLNGDGAASPPPAPPSSMYTPAARWPLGGRVHVPRARPPARRAIGSRGRQASIHPCMQAAAASARARAAAAGAFMTLHSPSVWPAELPAAFTSGTAGGRHARARAGSARAAICWWARPASVRRSGGRPAELASGWGGPDHRYCSSRAGLDGFCLPGWPTTSRPLRQRRPRGKVRPRSGPGVDARGRRRKFVPRLAPSLPSAGALVRFYAARVACAWLRAPPTDKKQCRRRRPCAVSVFRVRGQVRRLPGLVGHPAVTWGCGVYWTCA
eukprot:scaffold2088_cov399-Prasinococcus_capsulatus_cf.AAC.23